MYLTIEKENQTDWKAEILAIKKQFPYFIIPQVIADLQEHQQVDAASVYFYNLNPVLLATMDYKSLQKATALLEDSKVEVIEINNSEIIEEKTIIKEKFTEASIIEPLTGADFYKAQGIEISNEIPDKDTLDSLQPQANVDKESIIEEEQSLLVQMSFSEWLRTISENKRKEQEDLREQELLKNKWKQQKLAEAIQEENDEIPEQVFQMAVDSIEKEESLVSESLAEVYKLQGKNEQAISMYRKLILLNPEKKVYFADKIEKLQKNIT